jgi:lipoate---protein ligase
MFRKRAYSTLSNSISKYQGDLPSIIQASTPMTPYAHLAFESTLFRSKNTLHPTCFIRTNKEPGFVVVGKNQFAQAECNLDKMEKDGVKVVRRESGGGAVLIDSGNCMFGIVGNTKNYPDLKKETCHQILINAINKTFGVESYVHGAKQNDIYVNNCKVAGLAYSYLPGKDAYLYHACILVDANLTKLSEYLTPNQKKLASKGIQSISQRVTNLVNFDKTKTREDLEKNLQEEFSKRWGQCASHQVSEEEAIKIPEVFTVYQAMQDPHYLLKKPDEYNLTLSNKFPWGFVELYINAKDNAISDVFVNTDTLDVAFSEKLSSTIKSNTSSDVPEVEDTIKWLKDEFVKLGLSKQEESLKSEYSTCPKC